MATTYTTDASSPFADQCASLIAFLASANHDLPLPAARDVCAAVDLSPNSDFKVKAKRLRTELLKHAVQLGQAHALEALSRMAGFTSYMRAREAMKQQAGDFAREGFLVRVRVTGKPDSQFVPYAALPQAANAVIEQVMAQLTIPHEPVFCELRRTPQSVAIEVTRAEGAWFTIEMLPYTYEASKVEIVEFDAESQRTFLTRILRALERGCPGTLALYGVVPQTLAPWHYASFTLTFSDSGVLKSYPDERELFFAFASLGLQNAAIVNGEIELIGSNDSASLRMAWNRYDAGMPPSAAEMSSIALNSLVERYRHWRHGLRVSVNEAVLLVATGSVKPDSPHSINMQLLATEREKHDLSQRALAALVGLTEQDIQRIERYGFSTEKVIAHIAKALHLDPNALVENPEGQVGFEITEAQHLLNAMKGVHQYRTSFPEDIDGQAEAFIKGAAEELRDLGDILAMQDGVFAESMNLERMKPEDFLEDAKMLLDNINNEGFMLIAARGVTFATGNQALRGVPLQQVTFRFQPREVTGELVARS